MGAGSDPDPFGIGYFDLLLLSTPAPALVPIVDNLAPDMGAAIWETLRADAEFMTPMRGGFWHEIVPPRKRNPCGIYLILPGTDEGIGGKKFIRNCQIQVSIYANAAKQAADIADRAVEVLTDENIVWKNGRVMFLRLNNPGNPAPPTAGYGGSNVQGEIRTLDCQFHGEY